MTDSDITIGYEHNSEKTKLVEHNEYYIMVNGVENPIGFVCEYHTRKTQEGEDRLYYEFYLVARWRGRYSHVRKRSAFSWEEVTRVVQRFVELNGCGPDVQIEKTR